MEFTKGEWVALRGGEVIAKYRSPITGVERIQNVAHIYGEDTPMQEANTIFIAAAPLLYEALLLAKGTLEAMHISAQDPRYIQILQVLAKAEGKEK